MILDKLNTIQDLRELPQYDLPSLAEEIRQEIRASVGQPATTQPAGSGGTA